MNKLRLVSLIGVLTLAACDQEQDLRTQRNIQLVERFHGEVWSDGNVDLLDEMLGDDYVKHWAAYGPTVGRDELKAHIDRWRASFPDWNERIDAIEASGDMVFTRWTETGTFVNDFAGMKANGNTVKIGGMGWFRFENDIIVEEWTIIDNWGSQIQLDVTYPERWFNPAWK